MESYIIIVFPERFSGVFPPKKVKKSFVRSMKAIVVIMPGQNLWWPRLFITVFTAGHADAEDLVIPDPEAQLVAALHGIPDWTVPYLTYMTRGELPKG